MIYYIPPVNILGKGCLTEIGGPIKKLNCKKALIVSDNFLVGNGTVKNVTTILEKESINFIIFSDVKPNPAVSNVGHALKLC